MERITPLPAPISTPVGPFILSTQPGSGSATAGVTAHAKEELVSIEQEQDELLKIKDKQTVRSVCVQKTYVNEYMLYYTFGRPWTIN